MLQSSRIITVLACSGRVLRLLEHCRVRKLVELESIPTVLHVPKNATGNKILVGFSDGRVSMFRIHPMLTEGLFDVEFISILNAHSIIPSLSLHPCAQLSC